MKRLSLIVGLGLVHCGLLAVPRAAYAQLAEAPESAAAPEPAQKMVQGTPKVAPYFDRPAQRTLELSPRFEVTLLGQPETLQPRDLWGGALFVAFNIIDMRKGNGPHCDTWRVCIAPYLGWRFAAGKAELKTSEGAATDTQVATSYHAVSGGLGLVWPWLPYFGFRFAVGVTVPFVRASMVGDDDANTIDFIQTPFCGEAEANVRIPLSPFAKKRDWGVALSYAYRLCTVPPVKTQSNVEVDSDLVAMRFRGSILGAQVWLRF